LAVDLDPQSNLSQALLRPQGYVKHLQASKPTVVQILDGYMPATSATTSPTPISIDDVIIKGVGNLYQSKLDLIPSRLELSHTLRNPTGKERRLAKGLAKVADRYELVIIDCAPTDSILTDAAYFASRYVFIPIKPEFMATIGLPLLASSLEKFRAENEDHTIEILGIGFNHSSDYSVGPEASKSISDVKKFAAGTTRGWRVFENHIRYSRSYAKAAREGATIGSTSHVRVETRAGFRQFQDEFFAALGV